MGLQTFFYVFPHAWGKKSFGFQKMRFRTFMSSLPSRNWKDHIDVNFINLPGGFLWWGSVKSKTPIKQEAIAFPSSSVTSGAKLEVRLGRRKTVFCERRRRQNQLNSFSKGADGETGEKRRCGHRKGWERDRREKETSRERKGEWVERGRKRQQHSHTHTATMGEEDNTLPVGALISKMAAKHLTRVLFLSALSSAISSSLSRSCSRQTFSSLVNTANSCGAHAHLVQHRVKQTSWK